MYNNIYIALTKYIMYEVYTMNELGRERERERKKESKQNDTNTPIGSERVNCLLIKQMETKTNDNKSKL